MSNYKTNKTKFRKKAAMSIMGAKKWEAVPRRLLQTSQLDTKAKATWMYLLSRYDLAEVSLKQVADALGMKNKKSAREAITALRDAGMLTTSVNDEGIEKVESLTALSEWKYAATPFSVPKGEAKEIQDVDGEIPLDTKLGKLTSDRAGWFPVPNSIWHSNLSLAEIMVWCGIMCTSDWWYPGYRELGHYAGIRENKKIDAAVRSLEAKSIISVRWGEVGMQNKYRLSMIQEWNCDGSKGSPITPGQPPITPPRPPITPHLDTLSRDSSLDTLEVGVEGEGVIQEEDVGMHFTPEAGGPNHPLPGIVDASAVLQLIPEEDEFQFAL